MSSRVRTPLSRVTALGLALGVAGAFATVTTGGASVVSSRERCRATVFVADVTSNSVSTIDVKTRTKYPADFDVGASPSALAITPDGKTVFLAASESVSTIDVATRAKNPTDIPVGQRTNGVAITPDGKTAFLTNYESGSVSAIDVKSRSKKPTDIGGIYESALNGVAITPDGKTVVVVTTIGALSTIDVRTRKKNPTDIRMGEGPSGVAIMPCHSSGTP